jgi:hypothetical protein
VLQLVTSSNFEDNLYRVVVCKNGFDNKTICLCYGYDKAVEKKRELQQLYFSRYGSCTDVKVLKHYES